MITSATAIAFALASLVLIVIPGPSVLFVVGRSLTLGRGAVPVQLIALGLIFVLVALVSDAVWALVAGTARGWFATSPKRLSRMTGVGGGMMIGLGGVLLVTGHKR